MSNSGELHLSVISDTRNRTFRTEADAERYERDELTTLDRGGWIDPTQRKRRFDDCASEWLTLPGRGPRTIAQYKWAITRANEFLGRRQIGAITTAHVQSMIAELVAKGIAPSGAAAVLRVVRARLNEAHAREMIPRNPCRSVRVPQAVAKHRDEVTPQTVDELAELVGSDWRVAVPLGGLAGLRIGEVFGLQVGDIDFARRTISVRRQAQENGGPVEVAAPKTAAGVRTLAMPDRIDRKSVV